MPRSKASWRVQSKKTGAGQTGPKRNVEKIKEGVKEIIDDHENVLAVKTLKECRSGRNREEEGSQRGRRARGGAKK